MSNRLGRIEHMNIIIVFFLIVVQSVRLALMDFPLSVKLMLIGSCGPCPLDCRPRYSNHNPCGFPASLGRSDYRPDTNASRNED